MTSKHLGDLDALTAADIDDGDLFLVKHLATGLDYKMTKAQLALAVGGSGGAVDSVNTQTGAVVLDAGDVGADPAGAASAAQAAAETASDPAGSAATAVGAHVVDSDPHGDRAYTDSLAANYDPAGAAAAVAAGAVNDGDAAGGDLSGTYPDPSVMGIVRNGLGVPNDSIGQDGDWFMVDDHGDVPLKALYGPKAGGSWPTSPLINFVGGADSGLLVTDENNNVSVTLTLPAPVLFAGAPADGDVKVFGDTDGGHVWVRDATGNPRVKLQASGSVLDISNRDDTLAFYVDIGDDFADPGCHVGFFASTGLAPTARPTLTHQASFNAAQWNALVDMLHVLGVAL